MTPIHRRNILKCLAAGAAIAPLAGQAVAQDGPTVGQRNKSASLPAVKDAVPSGVWAFVTAAKAAHDPEVLAELFRGADSDFLPSSFGQGGIWGEASPLVMINESVHMITPGVASIDAEIGRFRTVGGWQGSSVWIVLESRSQGASQSWQPVLVRLGRPASSPISKGIGRILRLT